MQERIKLIDEQGENYFAEYIKDKGYKISKEKLTKSENLEIDQDFITFDYDLINDVTYELNNTGKKITFSDFDKKNKVFKKIKAPIPLSLSGFYVDILLRIIFLWLYYTNMIGIVWFLVIEVIIIPITLWVVLYSIGEIITKKLSLKFNVLAKHIEIELKANTNLQGILMILSTISMSFLSWYCMPDSWSFWLRIILEIIFSSIYFIYFGVSFFGFYIPFWYRYEDFNIGHGIQHAKIDKNDVEIATLQIKVDDLKQKIDTYTIESALMGALAISSYLAIFQSGVIEKQTIPTLETKISNIINDFLFFRGIIS
jgi:hypothetical protein